MDEKYVFISYKVEEYDAAKAVKDHLEANGIPCWMAPMSIRGGMSYAQEIPPAIQGSSVFLLMLSEAAQASKWVPREVDQAINCGKLIMPYMLENCPLRSDFSFYLTNVQRYEAFRDPEETLARMTRDIQNALGITPPEETVEEEVVEEEKPKETPKPKPPKKEKKPAGKKKKLLPWILGGAALVLALVLVLLLPGKPTIGGQSFAKDAFSVTLEEVTLTQAEVDLFDEFTDLCVIRLKDCVLDAQDLSPLARNGLMTLELTNCGLTNAQMGSIDFAGIRSLRGLYVSGNPALTSLGGLTACTGSLTELDISDTGIQSFDWLAGFTSLEILRADRTGLQDTALLEAMIYLETLSLSGNGITSLEGLKNTSKLTKVDLSHNSLTDVSVLSRSEACLTELHLEHNQLTDLICLANTENLKKVYVDNNYLSTIFWLGNNQNLQILSASHNEIMSIPGLGIGEKMRYLNLSNNKLVGILEGDLVFGENNYLVVDLSNNQLQQLNLPQNCSYKVLALLGNPQLELSQLNALAGWDVYFDFPAEVELETLKALSFYTLCAVDCPLSRQVEVEEGLTTENLMTREAALEEIAAAKESESY